jgi:hypothetical protein
MRNLKNILQWNFFDPIWKSGNDAVKIWDYIDQSILKEGIAEFLKALHLNKYEVQKKAIEEISTMGQGTDDIIPLNGKRPCDFPSLVQYGIPMVKSCIHSVLCNVYNLNQIAAGTDFLTFPLHNKATCSLIRIPSSTDYNSFKRNVQRTKWLNQLLLLNSGREEKVEQGITWLLQYLGKAHSDSFTAVACKLGLLLAPKVMDAKVPLRCGRRQTAQFLHKESFYNT